MSEERKFLPSASAFPRLDACPGSHLLAIELRDAGLIPEEIRTKDSDAGTMGHTMLEFWARNPQEFDQPETVWSAEAQAVWAKLSPAMQDTFWMATAQAAKLLRGHGFPYRAADFVEERMWLTAGYEHELGSAKLDCVWVEGEKALIIDWKTLYGDHDDADINGQLRMQVACASQRFTVPLIIVAVVQPRAGAPTVAKYTSELQKMAYAYCQVLAEAAMDPEASRAAGEHCKNCDCLAYCPEAARVTDHVAQIGELPLPIEDIVAKVGPEELSALMRACSIAALVQGAVKAELRRRIEAGQVIEGPEGKVWQIGKGKTLRPVEDPQLLWQHAVAEVPDLSVGDMMSCVVIPKGSFEEMLRPKAGLDGRKNAGAWKDLIAKVYAGCLGEKTTEGSLELVDRQLEGGDA
jgi:hypothetical protein